MPPISQLKTPPRIHLPTPTEHQRRSILQPSLFRSGNGPQFLADHSGRGSGKSLASLLTFDRAARERPATYWWLWPTRDAGREFGWDQFVRPLYEGLYEMAETTLTLTFPNGAHLRIVGADKVAAHNRRGGAIGGFIMEECRNVGRHVYSEVLLPMIARTGGWGQFKSTPRPGSWFDRLVIDAKKRIEASRAAGTRPEWQVVHSTAHDNPHHPQDQIAMMLREMTEREAAIEVYGRLLTDGGLLFPNVEELCCLSPADAVRGRQYIIGCDWARKNDETVFSVWDASGREQVCLERHHDVRYAEQVRALKALVMRYNRASVISEVNGMGDPVTEAAEDAGIDVIRWTSNTGTKAAIVKDTILAMEDRSVKFLNDEDQKEQLLAYGSIGRESGLPAYGAPSGMHDDIVSADMLAISGMGRRLPVPGAREHLMQQVAF